MAQVYVRQSPPVRPQGPSRAWLLTLPVLLVLLGATVYAFTGSLPGFPSAPVAAASPTTALSASPARVDFPDVATGRRGDPVTIVVTNNGTAAAHLGILTIGGQDRGDVLIATSTCWQETLPPGDHCTVRIAFTPTAPGRRSAVLTVAGANGGDGVAVSLQGTGIGAAPASPGATVTAGTTGTGRHAVVWLGAESRTVEATSGEGALVPYQVSPTVDGIQTAAACTPLAGTFPLGTTRVTCTVETGAGSVSTGFDVTVRDTTAPVFRLPSDVVIGSDSYSYTPITASDTVDGAVSATCTPKSPVALKPLLPTKISCVATDHAGNTGRASYNVIYVFKLPTILVNPPSPSPSRS